jgi:Chalcone isomerase-like
MRRVFGILLAAALAAPVAYAGELAGVTMPDQVTVSGETLHLNGMGVRKKLWIKVYIGGLYLENATKDASEVINSDQVKRVVMHFRTNKASKGKMDDGWDEGFQDNSPDEMAALKDRIATFKSYFGDMKVDDVVEMTMVPGEGTTVVINGTNKGTIEGDDFAKALMRVWFGDHPPTEDLKEGMLGKAD